MHVSACIMQYIYVSCMYMIVSIFFNKFSCGRTSYSSFLRRPTITEHVPRSAHPLMTAGPAG